MVVVRIIGVIGVAISLRAGGAGLQLIEDMAHGRDAQCTHSAIGV